MPDYFIYSTRHLDGTAIIIKAKIKHCEVNNFRKDYLEATDIIIEDWHGSLTISAINVLHGML